MCRAAGGLLRLLHVLLFVFRVLWVGLPRFADGTKLRRIDFEFFTALACSEMIGRAFVCYRLNGRPALLSALGGGAAFGK